MKIGIITFHASLNCGSMLQAYALSTIIKEKYGADVEMINYSNKGQRNYYSLWDPYLRPNVQKNNLKALPHWSIIKKVRTDYLNFSDDNFKLSGPVMKKYEDLKSVEDRYDIVIAGGDQVWNIMCRDADRAYFLKFVKSGKKVAYSPSMGAMNINEYAQNPKEYAEYINQFDYLSIREPNGQKWIKDLTGKDIPIIADPTLLLSVDEWTKSLNVKEVKEKFIFYYAFAYGNTANNEIIKKLSEKTGLPVYVIDGKAWAVNHLGDYGIKMYPQSGPYAFLELMKNAEIVITQSFHGTVFASLFHRHFWSIHNKVIKNKNDDRAISILRQVGLEDHYVCIDDLLDIDLFKPIDYEYVDNRIAEMRKNGLEYIAKFMEE